MKIKMTKVFASIVATSFVLACGTRNEAEKPLAEMSSEDFAKTPAVLAMVEVDANGKITKVEKRTIDRSTPLFANVDEASEAFKNANTTSYTEDTSADSYYVAGFPGVDNNFTNVNVNTQWNGFGYTNPGFGFDNNLVNNNVVNNNIINNNVSNANVMGCGNFGVGCFNAAYAVWPTFVNSGCGGWGGGCGFRPSCGWGWGGGWRGGCGGCRRYFYRW